MTIIGLALALLLPATASAAALPVPPCGTPPEPPYAAPGAPPNVQTWSARSGAVEWGPPACTGWAAQPFALVTALAARFAHDGDGPSLLARFGQVSAMRGIKYWSVTDGAWRTLITDAAALDGPDPRRRRPDFAAAELKPGGDDYFLEDDSRSFGHVVYRMHVLEAGADRVAVSIENVSRIRILIITLFDPGELKSVHFLTRTGAAEWGYYSLSAVPTSARGQAIGHEASFVNRAVALYRYLIGVPTDRDPPVAR